MASPVAGAAGRRPRSHRFVRTARAAAIALSAAVVAVGCGSSSGTADEETTIETVFDSVVAPTTELPVDNGADAEEDASSLPPNIWPEEIVETSEVDVSIGDESAGVLQGKDVVTRAADAVGDGVSPVGVSSVLAQVTSADGESCEVCLWLAEDDATRQRGLMGVTDLGDAVGMVFRWDEPRTGNFVMFQTPTPLSIAWFDEQGDHISQADMEPCMVENSATCERYTADSPYVLAVEMFGGQLDAVGIGPGSSIEISDLLCT